MESLEELYKRYESTQGNLCPGAILGIRMAVLGCHVIGIKDPHKTDRGKLIVWVEIDRWLADSIEIVTGAKLGKRTLKFRDYGKVAATFFNLENGNGVRVVALESSRQLADCRHPEIDAKYLRQITVYREASDEELFSVKSVAVRMNEKDAPGHPRSRVVCAVCGEGVNDGREVKSHEGKAVCRPCAFEGDGNSASDPEMAGGLRSFLSCNRKRTGIHIYRSSHTLRRSS